MKTKILTTILLFALMAMSNLTFAQDNLDISIESFDEASSIEGWTEAGDAASKPEEVTLEWAETAGVESTGAMRFGGVNANGEGGRAYILEKVFTDIDFGGETAVTVSVSIKSEALAGTNVFVLTDIGGSVVQRNDGIISELSDSEYTTFDFDHESISSSANSVKLQFNLAAGAEQDLGGTILIDNIEVTATEGDGNTGGEAPSAPAGFVANNDNVGSGEIFLAVGPNDAASDDIEYRLFYSETASAPTDPLTATEYTFGSTAGDGGGNAAFGFNLSGLNPGTEYTFWLYQFNNADSLFSDPSSASAVAGGSDDGGTQGEELLTNGDFEDGRSPWTDTAGEIRTEGDNSFFFANVETAGQPFNVNLSQAGLNITQDSVYTLEFNASTGEGNTRTMIVGIGLNVDPFTAATETVTLTEGDSTYSIQLQANFESNDARVLFDMGAEVGIVVLDNVSLVQGGEVSDEPVEVAVPDTAAPTPPTRDAEDVISLFSDAYTNVDVTTFATEWSQGSSEGNIEIADGDSIKLFDIGNFIGIQLSNSIDLSGFTHMHFDYWVADESLEAGAVFNPKLSNHGNLPDEEGETNAIGTANPVDTTGVWMSFDVALDEFTAETENGTLDRDKIYQIVMTTAGTINKVYIDNLYFYKGTGTSAHTNNDNELPSRFSLEQNYPNPFNPTTIISYQIPQTSNVTLTVFDITGREIVTFNEGRQSAGSYTVTFDANNLSSGLYIYRIQAGNFTATKKMMLIK